jgi:hypothetical protein
LNATEFKRLFPNASAATLRRNADLAIGLQGSQPKRHLQDDPLESVGRKESRPAGPSRRVAIICRRIRLQDPDNACVKYLVDALRHEKLIPDDSPDHIVLEVRQEKVDHKADEETVVKISPL